MTSKKPARSLDLYLRLLRQAKPYWRYIALYFVISVLATPLALLLPVPLKIVFDSVLADVPMPWFLAFLPDGWTATSDGRLGVAVGLLLCTTLLLQAQAFAMNMLYTYAGQRMVFDFRAKLFRHAQRLSLAYHDSRGVTDSIYRIQYDSAAIQHIAIDGVIPFITSALTLIAMISITAWLNLKLALVAISIAPILLYASRRYSKKLRTQWTNVKELDSSALGVVQEALSSVRVVKAFGQEERHGDHLESRSRFSLTAKMEAAVSKGLLTTVIGMTTAIGTAAVLFLGVLDVRAGVLTLGGLLVVMAYLSQLYGPLKTLSNKAASVQGSLAGAERAFTLLDEAPEVVESPNALPLARSRGDVAFENVSFRYDDGTQAVRDISLTVPAGTRVGIAGRTGAGKTTLMNLLCRFYDPQAGRIRLDGIDTRDFRVKDLRDQFGIVLQDPVLFSNSVSENIAYARPEATRAEVEAAAKAAGAHEFILGMPEQYDTRVGERGMRLSGGERQRISLARAFLKDAPILILDEPTSSVDVKTEAEIMAAMQRLMVGRTAFMIAHRLSTLDHCDLVIELGKGRIRNVRDVGEAAGYMPNGGSRAS